MRSSVTVLLRVLAVIAGMLLFAVIAWGQAEPKPFRYNGNVYGQGNVGGCVHGVFFGGGGGGAEGFLWKGLTAGLAGSINGFSRGESIKLFTGQIGYHFVDREKARGSDPFVSLGLGVGNSLRGDMSRSANLGGGLNYWMSDHVALRFEGRVIGIRSDTIGVVQIGVSFR
jgi:hypothetical protein